MITNKKQRHQIIDDIKSLLVQQKQFLTENHGDSKDLSLLDDLLFQMDDLFLLVVAGEFNSGKSAFINALFGESILDTGVTPTTEDVTILRFGETRSASRSQKGQMILEIPIGLLEDISIVDTPGTNAVLREHEELTTDFIPRSDLVLFVTSVDRPFTESERKFIESIRDWGKKIVIIINKIDIVDSQEDLEKVKSFVSTNSEKLLGFAPQIFVVSAKEALKSKMESGKPTIQLKAIEDYINQTLDTKNRFQLKLGNPLGILENFIKKYKEINAGQKDLIKEDVQLLDDIGQQITLFKEDMLRAYKFRYADIDNAILEFEKRGLEYFENTFRISRVMDLMNKERIKNEFNKSVVKDLSKNIDSKVSDTIEWLVDEDQKQWQIITRKINQRTTKYKDRILNDPDTQQYQSERRKIIASINREAQRIVEQYDKEDEAAQIAEEAQMAVAASAAVEAGAIGLGTLVTLLATTASADLTGILLAGLTATLGFFIIPAKKRQTKNQFSKNIAGLRKRLSDTLLKEFSRHIDILAENIHTTIQPYSRFIRAEQDKLAASAENLENLSTQCAQFRTRVEQLK